jgi:hypothetical protein
MNCPFTIRLGLNEASRGLDVQCCLRAWEQTNPGRPTYYLSLGQMLMGAAVAAGLLKEGEAGRGPNQSSGKYIKTVSKDRQKNGRGRRGQTALMLASAPLGWNSLARELADGTKFQGFEIPTHESLPTPAAGLFPAGEDR